MKIIDRLIFGIIAASLLLLVIKTFMPEPVRADPGTQTIDVNIAEIGGNSMAVTRLKRWLRDK